MNDSLVVVLIALGCAGAVGLAGVLSLRLARRRSLRTTVGAATVIAVLAVVAGILGTSRAMFLSPHDLGVVLVVSLVAGAVALVAGLAVGRLVMAETDRLQDAARRLADGTADEPPRLATSELAALGDELAQSARRLGESRRRAAALEASRRELVAWVSHDLRTPLAGLRAMAEALEDGVAPDPGRYHRQMRIEVDRLAALVDDLFELSRIQAGALGLRLEPVSLHEVLSDVVAGTQPLASARRVHLDASAVAVPVVADARELSRAVTNLVVNAIRHTPADGSVHLAVEVGERDAVLSVQDACGGIPDDDLGRVFDVAWRGTPSRTPDPAGALPGAGLGLAIVRGIVEAHDGTVSVGNSGPGCRFELRLPRPS